MQNLDQLLERGIELYQQGALAESARYLETCIKICQETGQEETQMLGLSNLSEAYMRLGRFKDAQYASFELLALARRCKSIPDEVRAIGRLAMAALILDQRSRWGELKAQLEDAIKTAREIRLQYWVVQNFETLGGFALSIGDVATAFDWFQQALNAISGDVYEAEFFKARIYCGIAECMVKLAKPARAVEFADLAVTTAEKTGSPHLIAICRLCKSKITACAGDTSEALRLAMGVQVRAAREGWKFEEFSAQKVLLNCLHNLDRSSEAYESAMRALSLAEELSLEEEVVVHLVEVGNVCLKLGLRSDGNKYFQRAAELATKLGRYELVSRARLAMANIGSK